MISRSEIIRGRQVRSQAADKAAAAAAAATAAAASNFGRAKDASPDKHQVEHQATKHSTSNKQVNGVNGRTTTTMSNKYIIGAHQNATDAASSEGYACYASATNEQAHPYARTSRANNARLAHYRPFDPYSIYSEEEDVWCSEERLFEVSLLLRCRLLFSICAFAARR